MKNKNRSTQDIFCKEDHTLNSYIHAISEFKLLSKEEERKYLLKKDNDPEALDVLIKHNLRLVIYVARKYQGKGLPLLDLIEEGNIGLIKAIKKFDVTRKTRLSTYAVWWVKQRMLRAIEFQTKSVDSPEAFQHKRTELVKKNQKYIQIDTNLIYETETDDIFLRKNIDKILGCLDERERRIIKRQYGITNGGEGDTLSKIALAENISRERVRQIENKAFLKLKKNISEGVLDDILC